MEKLSDDLTQAFKKNKTLEVENKDFVEEVTLHAPFIFLFIKHVKRIISLVPSLST
jgi:hypothetical protein